jgi:hypothetical protein
MERIAEVSGDDDYDYDDHCDFHDDYGHGGSGWNRHRVQVRHRGRLSKVQREMGKMRVCMLRTTPALFRTHRAFLSEDVRCTPTTHI